MGYNMVVWWHIYLLWLLSVSGNYFHQLKKLYKAIKFKILDRHVSLFKKNVDTEVHLSRRKRYSYFENTYTIDRQEPVFFLFF